MVVFNYPPPDAPWPELRALGVIGTVTCYWVPFQVQGSIEGGDWYFRAHHCRWSLSVSIDPSHDAVAVDCDDPGPYGTAARVSGVEACGDHHCEPECLSGGPDYSDPADVERAARFVAGALASALEQLRELRA